MKSKLLRWLLCKSGVVLQVSIKGRWETVPNVQGNFLELPRGRS